MHVWKVRELDLLSARKFLAERNIPVLEQYPYSSVLALCDIFIFLKVKEIIKDTRFEGMEVIYGTVTTELKVSM